MSKASDLTGQKFGKLTAISRTGQTGHRGAAIWMCVCECGSTVEVESYNLRSGRVKSCGCGQHAPGDYTGVRRGDLIGVRRTGKTCICRGKEQDIWLWQCKCGNRVERPLSQVYPKGISCCPECSRKRRVAHGYETRNENLVEGTNLTSSQLKGILDGKLTKANRSGIRGVSWAKNANKWTARGFRDGKPIHLGYFESIEDAANARREFLNRNLDTVQNF